jgi:outer membrane protein OmpA-like peptidoglycan-associated protein
MKAKLMMMAGLLAAGTMLASAQSAIETVVTLTGSMLNATSLTPVEANYSVLDASGKKLGPARRSNAIDGYLVTGLRPGESYTIRIEDPRYFRQDYAIQIPKTSKYVEISKDFTVKPMEAGRSIAIAPAPFDLKKTALKVGSDEILGDMSKMLVMNPSVSVELVCYPDLEGSAADISKLTADRAAALKAYLMKNGVSEQRIKVRQVSTTDPINPPPIRKGAKGKRYVGPVYLVVTKV